MVRCVGAESQFAKVGDDFFDPRSFGNGRRLLGLARRRRDASLLALRFHELRAVFELGRVLIVRASTESDPVDRSHAAPGEADFLDRANAAFNRLRNFPKPVIAALNGVTMAGGLELALCADIVVAAESATIADAHANFGVYPGAGGAAVLPRLIPLNMAMYLLLTGKSLSATDMKACGLVCEVHADEALPAATLELAEHIAKKSPIALRRMKEVARASADKSRDDALLHEQVAMRQHMRTFDFSEGLQSFAEKRAPRFQGR